MQSVILVVHFIIAFAIIGLVLLQQGKGANLGATFGGGGSNSIFGSRGPASFLMKLTGVLAALFFATSLFIGHLIARQAHQGEQVVLVEQTVPAPASEKPTSL